MRAPAVGELTPCAATPKLHDSTIRADHRLAKAICDTCPFIDWCHGEYLAAKKLATSAGSAPVGPAGTWAGRLYGETAPRRGWPRKTPPSPLPAECGTHTGMRRHYRDNETPCDACKAFRNEYERERYAAAAGERGVRTLDAYDPALVTRVLDGDWTAARELRPSERRAVVREWVRRGRSQRELGRLTGWRVDRYTDQKPRRGTSLSDSETATIADLADRGWSWNRIALALGRNPKTVKRAAMKAAS